MKRNWVFIVVYASLSTHHGYADSTHSVTVYGNGFDTTRTDYRCKFRDGNGNQAYSATIGPASTTQMTCRSPYLYYASTDNSVTLYLMEQLNNDVQWLGSNRGWVYQIVYRYIEPRISSVRGGKVIKVSGYGMDVNRNDYVCIFRNQQGYERKSVAVKPNEGSYLQCTTPTFGSTLTLTSLILQENKKDVLWRGSDTWDRIINFARPLYIGYEKESKRNLAYYFNNVENKNVVLTPFGESEKATRSLSISASYDSTVYILSKNPNKIMTVDTMTAQVQFISPTLSCTTSSCSSDMSVSVIECDTYGRLYGIISNNNKMKFVQIDPFSGKVTWKIDLSLTGVAHGVSAQIGSNMVVVERPGNYLWTITMSNAYARRWYARPSNLIIHSLESIGENYIAATAYDESSKKERVVYFPYHTSSTVTSTNVGGGVRQGVSTYDEEINRFIHHATVNSKDVIKMVQFDGVDGPSEPSTPRRFLPPWPRLSSFQQVCDVLPWTACDRQE